MGTSGKFGGSTTGLVPSWVNDPPTAPALGEPDETSDDGQPGDGDGGEQEKPDAPQAYPPIAKPIPGGSLGTARGNITRGARTSDAQAIKRGVGQYVAASGGGNGASRQIPSSRAAAGGFASFAQAYINDGPAEALKTVNLEALAGSQATDVFVALTDTLCPPGGTIDEALARDAMLETIAAMTVDGETDFDDLSIGSLEDFFIGVISRSIEGKILNEIGAKSINIPETEDDVRRAARMLHDFVHGCVKDKFASTDNPLTSIKSDELDAYVDGLYASSFDLMRALGEQL